MDPDLELAQRCGFNTFDDIVVRIQEIVNILKTGKEKAEKCLDIYQELAKEYLKLKQKDKAKRLLATKKLRKEKINSLELRFTLVLNKIEVAENINEMQEIFNDINYCITELLTALDKNETGEETDEMKEYQDIIKVEKEITNYLETIKKFENEKIIKTYNLTKDEIEIVKKFGFNNFEEIKKNINDLIIIIQEGRLLTKKSFERFQIQAKIFLKKNQKDEAIKELKKELEKEEIIKNFDIKLYSILKKVDKIANFEQALDVLNEAKNCIDILLTELDKKEIGEEVEKLKEYQDLVINDKIISDYINIITSSKK